MSQPVLTGETPVLFVLPSSPLQGHSAYPWCFPAAPFAGRGAAGLLPGGEQQPSEFAGARVLEAGSFPCPGYGSVPLSLGLSPRIFKAVRQAA